MTADEKYTGKLYGSLRICTFKLQHELFVAYKILLERVLPIDTRILRFIPTTVKSLSVDGEERGGR